MSHEKPIELSKNLKPIHKTLNSTDMKFQKLFNTIPDIITIISFENQNPGNFIEINKAGQEKLGYTHDEFIKLSIDDIVAPDVRSELPENSYNIKNHYFETVFMAKNGGRIPVEISNTLLKIDERDVILSIVRDITQRKLSEEALNEIKENYRLISKNTTDVIWIMDMRLNSLTYISPSIYNLVGYTAEEIMSKSLIDFLNPQLSQYIVNKMEKRIKAFESGDESSRVQTDIIEHLKKDGTLVPAEMVTTLLADENGKVNQIMGVTRNITERKRFEDELRESEEFNRSIIAASPDCIKVLDLDGNLLMMSDGGQELMEVDDLNLILNKKLVDFYAEESQPDARAAIASAREGNPAQFTAYCPTVKGTPKWWDVIVTPILDANGRPEKLSAVSRDITQSKYDEEKLRWSEDRLMMGMDMANMVYWEYNTEQDLFTFDDQFYALYGTTAEEEGGNKISGQEYVQRFVDPSAYELMENEFAKTFEVDDPNFLSKTHHWMIRADGERRFIQVRFKIMFDEKGNKIGTRGVNQDITELKMAQDQLELNQDLLLMSMDIAKLVKWEYNIEKDLFTLDDHFYTLYGTNAEEQGGYQMPFMEYVKRFVPEEEKKSLANKFVKILKSDDPDITTTIQHWIIRGYGERKYIELRIKAIYDENNEKIGTRGVTQDITELKKTEEKLRQLLEDKDMLIKEIHHRVKNNLMIISSLLNLQSSNLKDQESKDLFQVSQNRTKTMALIHERLYQSDDLKRIGFKEYITTLSKDLYKNYVNDPNRVGLQLVVEDVDFDVDQAIPLGLILNEIITNSMKYGFPGDLKGKVFIDLSKKGKTYTLRVGDDGVGLPEDLDIEKTDSLGMQLITNLISQIDGEFELKRENGTEFIIKFMEKEIE